MCKKSDSPTKNLRSVFVKLGIILFQIVFIVFMFFLKNNADIAEKFTKENGRFHAQIFNFINKNIPISITEVLITIFIVLSIVWLIIGLKNFVKLKPFKATTKLLNIGLVWFAVLGAYSYSVELAYNRAPLELEIYEGTIEDKNNYFLMADYYVEDFNRVANELSFNENGDVIMPYDRYTLNAKLQEEYKKLDSDYFYEFTPTIKPMFYSFIYSMFGITGWYFGPFGEGVVNVDASMAETGFCYAHEMAHGKGVMREDDAQMTAAYICLTSDDAYLRYSGYVYTYHSALAMANYTGNEGDYQTVVNKIDPKIRNNFNYISARWEQLGLMDKIGDWLNNLYLQMSGDKDGTGSYSDSQPEFDDEGNVVVLSRYQKLFVQIYKERFPSVIL